MRCMSAMISDVIWPNHWALIAATVTDTKKMKIWRGRQRYKKYSKIGFYAMWWCGTNNTPERLLCHPACRWDDTQRRWWGWRRHKLNPSAGRTGQDDSGWTHKCVCSGGCPSQSLCGKQSNKLALQGPPSFYFHKNMNSSWSNSDYFYINWNLKYYENNKF